MKQYSVLICNYGSLHSLLLLLRRRIEIKFDVAQYFLFFHIKKPLSYKETATIIDSKFNIIFD